MSDTGTVETVTINIDGAEVEVPKGINVIEAAKLVRKEIPHYCYHPKLSVVGNCRMCLVELGMPMSDRQTREPILDEDGKQKIGWMPKPAIGCSTTVSPGLHVKTDSPLVEDCRNGVMEFLLINHPLDCPICDQAGECRLQEFASDYGRGYSRFKENKVVKPKRTRLGPRVMLDDERCVLCSRCIRFSDEIVGEDVLGFVDRGGFSTLTCYPGKELEHNYSLNTVDICPVGALTSTDFRFKMRVWFLKPVKSICTESSVGANTEVWSREGKIYRITPRRNDAVNDTWMTDSGRALYQQVDTDDRLTEYAIDGVRKPRSEAAAAACALLSGSRSAIVASPHSSVEEQFLLKHIATASESGVHMVYPVGEGDGLLLSEDRSPNLRGALLTGLIESLPDEGLGELGSKIDAGEIDTLWVVNEDVTALGLNGSQLSKVKLVYLGTHANATSQVANVVLPALTVFEREGCFVNQNFRLQKFNACVPGPAGVVSQRALLSEACASLRSEKPCLPDAEVLWQHIARELKVFESVTSFRRMPDEGIALDAAAFADLPFVETKNLKYTPAAEAVSEPEPATTGES